MHANKHIGYLTAPKRPKSVAKLQKSFIRCESIEEKIKWYDIKMEKKGYICISAVSIDHEHQAHHAGKPLFHSKQSGQTAPMCSNGVLE